MWVAEGLTHRYPTKVLAELLPTCPQYCGHCTRMDLVGNSTPVIDKLKFDLKPVDRYDAMIDYLRRSPGVRDVVVSGGDVANMPFKNLEAFVARLLDIENIRDIRLATKALMGLPQHWLQDDVRAGMERLSTVARARGVHLAIHTHVNNAAVGDAAGRRRDQGDARRRRARRAQPGRADARRQRHHDRPARPVLRAARRRRDHALLLLHVRHDPVLRALAGVGRRGAAAAARRSWATCPGSRRRASSATSRSSGSAGCTSSRSTTRERGISYWTKNYRTGIETADPEALTRRYEYYDPIHTLPETGQAWWREHGPSVDHDAAADSGRGVPGRGRRPGQLDRWPSSVRLAGEDLGDPEPTAADTHADADSAHPSVRGCWPGAAAERISARCTLTDRVVVGDVLADRRPAADRREVRRCGTA